MFIFSGHGGFHCHLSRQESVNMTGIRTCRTCFCSVRRHRGRRHCLRFRSCSARRYCLRRGSCSSRRHCPCRGSCSSRRHCPCCSFCSLPLPSVSIEVKAGRRHIGQAQFGRGPVDHEQEAGPVDRIPLIDLSLRVRGRRRDPPALPVQAGAPGGARDLVLYDTDGVARPVGPRRFIKSERPVSLQWLQAADRSCPVHRYSILTGPAIHSCSAISRCRPACRPAISRC